MNRRSFMKKMLGFGVGVPAVGAALVLGNDGVEHSDQPPTSGDIVVKSGAKRVTIQGNHLKGGNAIVEDGAEDVMVVNTLFTKDEEDST